MRAKLTLLVLGAALAVAGCDKSAEREAQAQRERAWASQNADKMAALNTKLIDTKKLSPTDAGRICRAAIGTLMGQDPRIIAVDNSNGEDVVVSYSRPDDGKIWRNHCYISGDRVNWAAILDGVRGRWRNEDDIRYVLTGPSIKITVRSDGELASEKAYQLE